jgi:hypothetical protein
VHHNANSYKFGAIQAPNIVIEHSSEILAEIRVSWVHCAEVLACTVGRCPVQYGHFVSYVQLKLYLSISIHPHPRLKRKTRYDSRIKLAPNSRPRLHRRYRLTEPAIEVLWI